MTRLRIKKVVVAAFLSVLGAHTASAASIAQWKEIATQFVTGFEGSRFDAITLDTDCQGLSLGKEQYAVQVNSTKEFFDEMENSGGLATAISQAVKTQIDEITKFIAESRSGSPERLSRVRSWQQIRVDGKWQQLDEGECRTGKKRSVGQKDLRLKPGFEADLKAFLAHPISVAAQGNLITRRAARALDRSTCWARAARKSQVPSFQEYLFFFDYLTQNGDSFTASGQLQRVALQIAFDDKIADARQDPSAIQKMAQINDWLSANFPHMRNKGIPVDHGDYARTNAIEWTARFKAGEINTNQLRLAYVGLMRAMLGNNQWGYNAMNRRGTVLFGGGTANGVKYEPTVMKALTDKAGALAPSEVTSIACPSQ